MHDYSIVYIINIIIGSYTIVLSIAQKYKKNVIIEYKIYTI